MRRVLHAKVAVAEEAVEAEAAVGAATVEAAVVVAAVAGVEVVEAEADINRHFGLANSFARGSNLDLLNWVGTVSV